MGRVIAGQVGNGFAVGEFIDRHYLHAVARL